MYKIKVGKFKTYFFYWNRLTDIFVKKVVCGADNGSEKQLLRQKSVDTDFLRYDFPFMVEHEKVYSGRVSFHGVRVDGGVGLKSIDEQARHVVNHDLGAAVGIEELEIHFSVVRVRHNTDVGCKIFIVNAIE